MRALATLLLSATLVLAQPATAQISLFGGVTNSLVQFLLDRLSTPDSFEITADGVESPEDGLLELVGVRIADARGVWLEVDGVGLDWNALRILRGELEIRRLTARGVRVLRRPEPTSVPTADLEDDSEPAPFTWPRSPITTRIDSLSLTDINIAEGVIAPQSLRFDATGEARDEGDEQALQLLIERTDDVSGRIALAYLRDFNADTLAFDLNAREGAGGVVAALGGLPSDTPVRATVQAIGPLDDWRVSLAAQAEDQFLLEGDGALSIGPPFALDATVTLTPGADLDPQIATVLGEEASLVARVQEEADGVIRIEEGRLAAPDIDLTAAGRLTRATGALDGSLTVEVRGGLASLVEGVDWDRVGFDGNVAGTLEALTAEGTLALAGLRTQAADVGTATLTGSVTRDGPRISADLSGGASALRVDRLGPDLLGQVDLSVAGAFDAGVATLDRLSLTAPLLTVEASGEADLNADSASLRYAAGTPDLTPIARAYDVDAGGRLRIDGTLDGALSAPHLVGALAAEALRYGEETYGRLALEHDVTLGSTPAGRLSLVSAGSAFGPAQASADFRLDQPQLTVSDFSADVLGVLAEGALSVDLETTLAEGEVAARIADLDALAAYAGAPVSGAAAGDIVLRIEDGVQVVDVDATAERIAGPGVALDRALIDATLRDLTGQLGFAGNLAVSGLDAADYRIETLRMEGTGSDLLAAPSVDASIDGSGLAGAGFTLDALRLEGTGSDLLDAPTVAATVEGTGLAGAGVTLAGVAGVVDIASTDGLPAGTATLTLDRLDAGAASLPDAEIALNLSTVSGTLVALLEATASRLALADGAVGPFEVTARIDDALGDDPALEATATMAGGAIGGLSLDRARITAEGTRAALAVTARAGATTDDRPLSLAVDSVIDAADPAAIVARLDRADASFEDLAVRLRRPATVTIGAETLVDDLDIDLPGGRLTASARQAGDGIAATLALVLDDLIPLAEFADLPLTGGAVALRADIDTIGETPRADAELTGSGLAFDGAASEAGAIDIDGNLRWRGQRADVAMEIEGPQEQPIVATVSLPVRRNPGGLPGLIEGGRIDGTLNWAGRIGDLWVLVPAPDHVLDGDVLIDLAIGGTLTSPSIGGEVTLRDGQYQNLMLGTILTDLTVDSLINPDGSFELDANAQDGSGGAMTAQVVLGGGDISASVNANGAILVRRDDVTAAVSLDITAAGPVVAPAVSGRVGIDRAEVNLAASFAPSIPDIGPVRIKGVEPEPEEEGAGTGIPLDIRIDGPRNIFVRGRGLDSEWRIDLRVGGTAAQPEIVGVIERIRGALNLIGFTFELETGEIRFNGTTPIDPTLDIRILRENEGVIGGIYVDGTGSDPNVEFRSVPELPEDEVLPRVLFGASQQSLTGTQALLIAGGVAELMGGSGLLSGVQAATGVDVLRLEDDGEGGADVTVGSNVADGVFVGAKQPLDGGQTRVTVEIEVFDEVIVDSEVSGEDTSIGVRWRRQF